MPALPPVPGVLKLSWRLTLGSDIDVYQRLHFAYTGTAPSDATCNLIAGASWLAYSNRLMGLYDTSVTLEDALVEDLTSPTSGSGQDLGPSPGTRAGEILPASTCLLVNYAIARRYRGGKPRTYFPMGIGGDLNTPQQWSTVFTAAVTAALDLFFADLLAITEGGTSVSQLVNVSYYGQLVAGLPFTSVQNPITKRWRNVPNVRTAPIVDPVLGWTANVKVGTQRRRNQFST